MAKPRLIFHLQQHSMMCLIFTADTWIKSLSVVTVNTSIDSSANNGLYLVRREHKIAHLNDNKATPNGKFPTISSRSWARRRANIDWKPCVALQSPQQMFFLGRFHCPVYFKLLRHSLEVKGPRMERVLWVSEGERRRRFFLWPVGQRAEGLMRKEQGVMCYRLFAQSYSSELKFNPSFWIPLHFS